MMTTIGKLLVYTLFVFSIFLAAMAWGILNNQLPWPTTTGPGGEEGLHDKYLKQIKGEQEDLVRLRGQWRDEVNALTTAETKRVADQKWYAEQLAVLRTGGKDGKGKVVKVLVYQPDGRLKLDANGRPVLGANPDNRLVDLATLDDQLKDVDDKLRATIKDINGLIEDQKRLTLELGIWNDKDRKWEPKGLLALLEDSDRDRKNAETELEAARQEAINGRVAVQVLIKRQKQLQARVKELRAGGVAQRQP